jgi:hypothetical protein
MNEIERQTKRNNVRRLFRHTSGIHVNCIRINVANTYDHEKRKFDECWKLALAGKSFITEGELENPFKKRVDICSLDDAVIIEVQKSETDESIEEKRKTYPLPIVLTTC